MLDKTYTKQKCYPIYKNADYFRQLNLQAKNLSKHTSNLGLIEHFHHPL